MKVAIAGGKTGGHLCPGVAIAEQLDRAGHSVVFLCSDHDLDRHILSKTPWSFEVFHTLSPSKGLLRWFTVTVKAFFKAKYFLKKYSVDAVIGMGGFVSVPMVLAARFLRLPVILMEPNVIPGKANRFLGRFAHKICLGFAGSDCFWKMTPQMKDKFDSTGVPVRLAFHEVTEVDKDQVSKDLGLDKSKLLRLVLGGSQGAEVLNRAMLTLVKENNDVQWVHLTGVANATVMQEAYTHIGVVSSVKVVPFYENMAGLMALADVIVSRAGAASLAEIRALGKPAIVVPLKHSADDHQLHNARACQKEGWAVCVEESEKLQESLASVLQDNFLSKT